MHDLALAAIRTLADASGTTQVEVAIIGSLALVLCALIPALLNSKEKEPRAIRDMRKDRDQWRDLAISREATVNAAVVGMGLRDSEIDRLQQLCMDNQINPFIPKVVEPHEPA